MRKIILGLCLVAVCGVGAPRISYGYVGPEDHINYQGNSNTQQIQLLLKLLETLKALLAQIQAEKSEITQNTDTEESNDPIYDRVDLKIRTNAVSFVRGEVVPVRWSTSGYYPEGTQIKLILGNYTSQGDYAHIDQIGTVAIEKGAYNSYYIPTNNKRCIEQFVKAPFWINCWSQFEKYIDEGKTRFLIIAQLWKGDEFLGVTEFSEPFTILKEIDTTAPSIDVFTPNVTVNYGGQYTVAWNAENIPSDVKFGFALVDSAGKAYRIGSDFVQPSSSGSFKWTMTGTGCYGTTCKENIMKVGDTFKLKAEMYTPARSCYDGQWSNGACPSDLPIAKILTSDISDDSFTVVSSSTAPIISI